MKFNEMYAMILKAMKKHGIEKKETYTGDELSVIATEVNSSCFFVNRYLTGDEFKPTRDLFEA